MHGVKCDDAWCADNSDKRQGIFLLVNGLGSGGRRFDGEDGEESCLDWVDILVSFQRR